MVVQGYGVVAVAMVTGTSSKKVTVEAVTSVSLVIVEMGPQGSVGVTSHSQSSATVSSCISTLPSKMITPVLPSKILNQHVHFNMAIYLLGT